MSDYRIGAGGWSYFKIPGMDSLTAYSRAFDFVEVNSTFYSMPSESMVDSWARKVPTGFEFSVRCHRDLTHKHMLNPTDRACRLLEEGIRICRNLGSRLLVIETPRSFDPNSAIQSIRDLLSSVPFKEVRPVWEIRRGRPSGELVSLMRDLDMVHCVDLSREQEPAYSSDILYSRLFGRGEHNLYQFDDDELLEIDNRTRDSESIYLSFHGGRMYKDAARLKKYKETGSLPRVTKHTGLESLREVLEEDARFPASRQQLMDSQGWKVIDVPEDNGVHAKLLLEVLNDRIFRSVDQVIKDLENTQKGLN